jgi:glycosyltransferase involved in cell wall biosynthesis
MGGLRVDEIANPVNPAFSRGRQLSQIAARSPLGIGAAETVALVVAEDLCDPNKGVQAFIDAVDSLRNQVPRIRVLLVGANSEKIKSRRALLSRMGQLDPEVLARIIPAVDFLMLSSQIENLPTTVLEAACSGVPFLTEITNIGGAELAIRYGLGKTHEGYQGLESKISELKRLRAEGGADIAKKADSIFGGSTVLKKYLDIYDRVTHRSY